MNISYYKLDFLHDLIWLCEYLNHVLSHYLIVCILFLQTYYGSDFEIIEDPVERIALKTMIKTYGQTPKQLFKNKHPPRSVYSSPRNKSTNKQQTKVDNKMLSKPGTSLADRSALNSRRVSWNRFLSLSYY